MASDSKLDLAGEVPVIPAPGRPSYDHGQPDRASDTDRIRDFETMPPRRHAAESAAAPCVRLPPGGVVWADLEKSFIEQALAQAGGNQVRAAKLLGLSRDALRYRMEKHGLGTRRNGADEAGRERCSR